MNGEELTGLDYMTRPLSEVASHPDFNIDVMSFIVNLMTATSPQIESIIRSKANG